MNTSLSSALLPILAILLAAAPLLHAQPEQRRPNIIFLMDDQHRWDGLGVVDPSYQTPTLDKLARAGVHYTQAVCQASMCIPSRNSMMFGLYGNQLGVVRNGGGIPDKIHDDPKAFPKVRQQMTKSLFEHLKTQGRIRKQ